jgi:hypothetical protein
VRTPRARHERGARKRRRRRPLDDRDHFVDVRQRHRQAFEHVAAFARLAQVEDRAPRDHLAPMAQERVEELLQVEELRLAVDERDHVHAEGFLHLRVLVEVVEDDLGDLRALELDHQAHAFLVGLVAQVGDALDALVVHQLADLAQELVTAHLVRHFVDDDRLPAALLHVLHVRARTHHDASAPREVTLLHFGDPIDDSGRREVRRRNDLDELGERHVGIGEQGEAPVDHLDQVVRRDVGRHADGDPRRAVHEEVRETSKAG